ncbi:HAD family hydrolase [Thalassospiraceae bacterium LMO-SO8]|nr:HAD family hydrolase [Alphaproteobacteria bacterium LMO-S08]WND77663.1 HAD family hydrolase [Thalassospiraceae bacterium LMO-SO8]
MPPVETTNKAVFLDRDGVLSRSDVRGGKPYAPARLEDFEMLPDAPGALRNLKQDGYTLIVVTNQPDVGNGLVDRAVVERMNARLTGALPIDSVKVCYHGQAEGCACRKPKPGMLLDAADELGIDLAASFMVGDRWSDIDAGRAAGCRTVFIDRGYGERRPETQDFTAASMGEAADLIRTAAHP